MGDGKAGFSPKVEIQQRHVDWLTLNDRQCLIDIADGPHHRTASILRHLLQAKRYKRLVFDDECPFASTPPVTAAYRRVGEPVF